jgi:hypothetical protein
VARRRSAQRSPGGGGGIQAVRKARARIALASSSALVYTGVLAYAAARVPSFAALVAGVGVFGAVLLAFVLVRRVDDLLPWALGMLGVAYTISLYVHGSAVDDAAPLVAAGLLLCGELAAWSLDERHAIAAERDVVLQRGLALGALVLAGLAAAAAVIAFAASSAGDGLAWTALGSVAAVLVVGVAAQLVRRTA